MLTPFPMKQICVGLVLIPRRLNLNSFWLILILPNHLYLLLTEGLDLKHVLSDLIGVKETKEDKKHEEQI